MSDLTAWILGRDGRPFTDLELHEPVDDRRNTAADLDIALGRAEVKVTYTRIGPMTREEEREAPYGWGWVEYHWVPLCFVNIDPGPLPQPAQWALFTGWGYDPRRAAGELRSDEPAAPIVGAPA
jgi:hypothetical protein